MRAAVQEMLQTMEDMVDIPTEWINNLTAMCIVQVKTRLDERDLTTFHNVLCVYPAFPQSRHDSLGGSQCYCGAKSSRHLVTA